MFEKLTSEPVRAMPSLNALRAFEAMARTGQATLAAGELCVTHSAVSRQVKALEAALGVTLFEGPRHRLTLTPAGRALAAELSEALDRIASAVVHARGDDGVVRLAVNASIALKWLMPRLASFTAAQVELSELAPHAMSHRGADAALRMLAADFAGPWRATYLMENDIGPVLAPELAARIGGDALAAPRLVSRTHPGGWADWARLAGAALPARPERRLEHLHYTLDAAVAGLGAAVLPWPLVAPEVEAGRLLAPLGFTAYGGGFALLTPPGSIKASTARLRDWLVAEGRATPPAPPSRA